MRAAIIGASEESLHTIEKAHEAEIEILALDGNPEAAGLNVADIPMVVNISDETATLEALQDKNIDFTLTVPIGRYLTTIGYINDKLKLPGISKDAAIKCTDKYLFHQTLSQANLRPCNCILIDRSKSLSVTLTEINSKRLGFPAILKPRYGSGSRGIYIVNNNNDLTKALSHIQGEDYVLEECIEGDEYGFDAAVVNGRLELILLRIKDNTPLPNRQAVAYYSVNPASELYSTMYEYIRKIVSVLNLDECLMHGDLIDSKNGPFAIEVSARPSGHNLHNLFTPLCTDIDMARNYIDYRLGHNVTFTPSNTRSMMIHYFDIVGSVIQIPSAITISELCAINNCNLVKWNCKISSGDMLKEIHNGHELMTRGYYIVEFPTFDIMREKKKQLVATIQAAFF